MMPYYLIAMCTISFVWAMFTLPAAAVESVHQSHKPKDERKYGRSNTYFLIGCVSGSIFVGSLLQAIDRLTS